MDVAPLSIRLREVVAAAASAATVTCVFVPGGRNHGVGIRGPHFCATCGQGRMWHVVAEALRIVEAVEHGERAAAAAPHEETHVS